MSKKKAKVTKKTNHSVMTDGVNFYHSVGDKFKQLNSNCALTIEEWRARGFTLAPVELQEVDVDVRERDTVQKDTESDGLSERDSEDE